MTDKTFDGEQWAAFGVFQERLHGAFQQNESPTSLIITLHYPHDDDRPTIDVDIPLAETADRVALDKLVLAIWEEANIPGYIVFGCHEEEIEDDLRVRTYVFCTPPCARSAEGTVEN